MMSRLLIIQFYPGELSQVSFVLSDENHSLLESASTALLSDLPAKAKEAEVIVVIPAEDVLLTEVTLPKLNRQRLRQALPFALEEQLIEEVDSLHFATGPYQDNGALPVAIVSRKKMTAWLNALKEAGIAAAAFIPETYLLPYTESSGSIVSRDAISLIRTGKFSGFACDAANKDTFLATQENELKKVTLSNQSLLEQLALQGLSSIPLNLLQHDFPPKRTTTEVKKIWMKAFYATLAYVGIAFFSQCISLIILGIKEYRIQSAIRTIYYHQFPTDPALASPKEKMEKKIKATAEKAYQNHFLFLLAAIGKSFSETKGIRLQHLDFQNNQLTLDVTAATFDSLDSFTQHVTQSGLAVKQQNAETAGAQAKATLLITAGAS